MLPTPPPAALCNFAPESKALRDALPAAGIFPLRMR